MQSVYSTAPVNWADFFRVIVQHTRIHTCTHTHTHICVRVQIHMVCWVCYCNFELLILPMCWISSRFCSLCSKTESFGHHDTIHSSRNLETACCMTSMLKDPIQRFHSVWVSIWGQYRGFTKSWRSPIVITKVRYSYLPNPSARAGCDTRSIFKRSLTGLNSEFSFS